MSEKEEKPSIFDRTTMANIAAFIVVVTGMAFAVWKGDMDTAKSFALIGFGYLLKSTAG